METAPDKECDLIMKGGIASGIVYPQAVLALKEAGHRFRCVGGTSAGAIAATATAAAEFGRETGGFDRLAALSERLCEEKFLRGLFQPSAKTRALMELASTAFGGGPVGRKVVRAGAARARCAPGPLVGGLALGALGGEAVARLVGASAPWARRGLFLGAFGFAGGGRGRGRGAGAQAAQGRARECVRDLPGPCREPGPGGARPDGLAGVGDRGDRRQARRGGAADVRGSGAPGRAAPHDDDERQPGIAVCAAVRQGRVSVLRPGNGRVLPATHRGTSGRQGPQDGPRRAAARFSFSAARRRLAPRGRDAPEFEFPDSVERRPAVHAELRPAPDARRPGQELVQRRRGVQQLPDPLLRHMAARPPDVRHQPDGGGRPDGRRFFARRERERAPRLPPASRSRGISGCARFDHAELPGQHAGAAALVPGTRRAGPAGDGRGGPEPGHARRHARRGGPQGRP